MSKTKRPLSPFLFIFSIALIGMLAPFSIDTYLPSFPSIEKDLLISRELLTQSLSIYLISFAVATLIWGPLSDRFGRKPIILISLTGFLVASLLAAMATTYEILLLGRMLQGFMVAGSMVASRAMIRDAFSSQEAQKAMAIMMMLFSIAPAIAPILGGWLEVLFGWRSIFYFLALYGLALLAIYLFKISETQAPEHVQSIAPKKLFISYLETIRHPQFLKIVMAQGALIGGFFIYISGSTSLIYDHLHLGEHDFWIFFVPVVSGILLGSIASHRLTHRLNATQIVNLAISLGVISITSNVLIESFNFGGTAHPPTWLIIAPLVLYTFSFALANPSLSILGLDCLPEKRGMASSVQSLFQMGTAGVVTALVVPVVHESLTHMALAQAMMLALTIVLWLGVRKKLSFRTAR